MDFDGMTFNRVTDHPECWVSDHLCRGTTALEDAMLSEIERLRAELAEWRKDAERYRWIRIAQNLDRVYELDGEVLDQMIDAARKGEGE